MMISGLFFLNFSSLDGSFEPTLLADQGQDRAPNQSVGYIYSACFGLPSVWHKFAIFYRTPGEEETHHLQSEVFFIGYNKPVNIAKYCMLKMTVNLGCVQFLFMIILAHLLYHYLWCVCVCVHVLIFLFTSLCVMFECFSFWILIQNQQPGPEATSYNDVVSCTAIYTLLV